jgi:hypothetical protein
MSVDQVRGDLGSMRSMFDEILVLSGRFGTPADTPALRSDLQQQVSRLSSLAQSTKGTIEALLRTEDPNVRTLQQSFSEIAAQMRDRLPAVIDSLRNSSSSSRSASTAQSSLMLNQQLLDRESEELEVLEQEVAGILRVMREVNFLFTQTLGEIQKQRHLVMELDKSTGESLEAMSEANSILEKAAGNQKSKTKCICWTLLIVTVIVAGVITFLVLYLEKS